MPDTSIFTTYIIGWFLNPLFWMLIILGMLIVAIFVLYIRKRRKLIYQVAELVDLGKGKFGINLMRGGWFGKKLFFKGLWWKGEDVLRVASGEEVRDFSTEDYQEINGRRGVVCFRDPINQDILVPINKADFINKEFLAEIAPASYRDAAVDIFHEGVKETADWKEKMIGIATYGIIIVFSLVSLILIIHFIKQSQAEAAKLMMTAGTQGIAGCKDMCKEIFNIAQGAAP